MRPTGWLAMAVVAAAGCSGLEAQRVPLSKRLEGKDDCVHGFRYYLSRPYLVVSKPVEVATGDTLAILTEVSDEPGTFYLAGKNAEGRKVLFDTAGHPLPPTDAAYLRVLKPVSLEAAGIALSITPQAPATVKEKEKEKEKEKKDNLPVAPEPKPSPSTPGPKPSLDPINPGSAHQLNAAARDATRFGVRADPAGGSKEDPPADPPKAAEEPDYGMKIIYLPDFEEQMAVRHHNFAAKADIHLSFADGWQLRTVNGSFDSTDLPIKILDTIRKAISAAGAVETKRLQLLGGGETAADPANDLAAFDQVAVVVPVRVRVRHSRYIEPGLYRLQKPGEAAGAGCGAGLLADLGVPVIDEVKVLLVK